MLCFFFFFLIQFYQGLFFCCFFFKIHTFKIFVCNCFRLSYTFKFDVQEWLLFVCLFGNETISKILGSGPSFKFRSSAQIFGTVFFRFFGLRFRTVEGFSEMTFASMLACV